MKCYNCNKEIGHRDNGHIYHCLRIKNKNEVEKKEARFKLLIFNFNIPDNKNDFEKLYETNSLPDFKQKFGLNYEQTLFLVNYFGIKPRTFSDAAKKIAQPKIKETNIKKYGASNPLSRGTVSYEKRNKTVKEKYGVDNVFQIAEVIKKVNTKEAHLKTSIGWKKWYYSLSKKEQKQFLKKTIRSEKSIDKVVKGYNVSKLEDNFSEFLNLLSIEYTRQFKLKKGKIRRYYDFYIEKYNLIIEIHGDYWHCNPLKYKETDKVLYIYGEKTVSDIWKRDKEKEDFAKNNGYDLIIIWENEIRKKSFDDVKSLILEKLEKYENKINQENQS